MLEMTFNNNIPMLFENGLVMHYERESGPGDVIGDGSDCSLIFFFEEDDSRRNW